MALLPQKIKISSTERRNPGAPFGNIDFVIEYGVESDTFGTIHGSFDQGYKRMDITAMLDGASVISFGDHKPTRSELEYFEVEDIDLQEPFINKMLANAFVHVIKYIFSYRDQQYNTLKIDHYIMDSLKIDMDELNKKYNIYKLKRYKRSVSGDYYFFRKPALHPLFRHALINPYIYPCTVLLRKKTDFVFKESQLQKQAVVEEKIMHCLISYLCRMSEVNFSLFPDVIIYQIYHYQAKHQGDTLEFQRNCVIAQDYAQDGRMKIFFDFPVTILSNDWGDTCFKLKINGAVITGNKFYFDQSSDDWQYRIGKYSQPINPLSYFIDSTRAHSYYYLCSREQSSSTAIYGYGKFEKQIKQNQLRIVDTKEVVDLVDALTQL